MVEFREDLLTNPKLQVRIENEEQFDRYLEWFKAKKPDFKISIRYAIMQEMMKSNDISVSFLDGTWDYTPFMGDSEVISYNDALLKPEPKPELKAINDMLKLHNNNLVVESIEDEQECEMKTEDFLNSHKNPPHNHYVVDTLGSGAELYDLTKIGVVDSKEPVMVQVRYSDNDKWSSPLQLIAIDNDFNNKYVVWDVGPNFIGCNPFPEARHIQPEQKTRPMNFTEVRELARRGATFIREISVCGVKSDETTFNPEIRLFKGIVTITGRPLELYKGYTLPCEDETILPLEMPDVE